MAWSTRVEMTFAYTIEAFLICIVVFDILVPGVYGVRNGITSRISMAESTCFCWALFFFLFLLFFSHLGFLILENSSLYQCDTIQLFVPLCSFYFQKYGIFILSFLLPLFCSFASTVP
jgi:hypothetical protein